MEAILEGDFRAVIGEEGRVLSVFGSSGSALFTLSPPPHAGFYQFAHHAIHGECPKVSFDPGHGINGWTDWYYLVNVESRSMERLNPWR